MIILGLLGFMEKEWEMRKECIQLGFEYDVFSNGDANNDVSSGICSWVSDQAILKEIFKPHQVIFTPFLSFDPFISQVYPPIFQNVFFYHSLKPSNYKMFFLQCLSYSSFLLTMEGQANFYPP